MWLKSHTDTEDAMRKYDRTDNDEPKWKKSNTESVLPTRA